MIDTLPVPQTSDTGSDDDDDLTHIYCPCNEDLGLCGRNLAGLPHYDDESEAPEELCVVCNYLRDLPCERCGG